MMNISMEKMIFLLLLLSQKDDFKNMTIELSHIIETLDFNIRTINIESVLDRMGFPTNWEELASIERRKEDEEE